MEEFVQFEDGFVSHYENRVVNYSVYYSTDEIEYVLNTYHFRIYLNKILTIPEHIPDLKYFVQSVHDIIMLNIDRFDKIFKSMSNMTICKLPNSDTQFINSDEYNISYNDKYNNVYVLFSYNCNRVIDIGLIFYLDTFGLIKLKNKFIGLTFDEMTDEDECASIFVDYDCHANITCDEFNEELFISGIKNFFNNNQELISFPDIPIRNMKSANNRS